MNTYLHEREKTQRPVRDIRRGSPIVILVVLLLSLLVPLVALETEAIPATPFLLGTTYGDGFAIEHYSDYTKKLSTPVNTYHNGQRWVPANHTVVVSGDPDYDFQVIEGKYQAFFRTDLTSGAPSGLDEDRYAVKFLVGNDWVVNRPDALFYRGTTGPPEHVAGVNNSIGSPVNTTFVYPEVFVGEDITLRYVYNRELLKEEFLLQAAPPAPTDPTDDLYLDLLFFYPEYVQIRADGILWDRNSRVAASNITFENATTSQTLFAMANPIAADADGAGLNLAYELDRDPPNLKIRLRVDSSWLQDADRVYPVILDPTLTLQPSEKDARVDELLPTTNYGTETILRIQSWFCSICEPGLKDHDERTFVQWDVSSIPPGVTITGANASLYMTSAPGSSRTYQAREPDASWPETGITWDAQPTMEGADADSVASGTTSNVWLTWDITPEVQAWYAGTDTNYGLRIRDSVEGSTTNRQGVFRSRESSGTEKPKLVVDYTEPPAVTDPAWIDLTFFNSLNGDGLPFFKFKVIISSDNDSALLERATFNPYPWNVSDTVSVDVKDFNDNILATQSAVELGGANSHTGISIGVGIAEVTPLFSDGRQHIWRFCPTSNCPDFEDNSTAVFGSALLATSLAYTFDVPEDEYIFAVSESSLIPLNEAAHTVPVGVAPKDLDELYWNQTRELFVADFDGTGDYTQVTDADALDFTSTFTIAFWVWLPSTATGDEFLISKNQDYSIYIRHNSFVQFRTKHAILGNVQSNWLADITDSSWHFLAVTFDSGLGSDNKVIYENGTQVASFNAAEDINTNAVDLTFGRESPGGSLDLTGRLANIQFYDSAKSDPEVAELWSRGIYGAPLETNLTAHWPLADLWSGLAHDYSGNDFHGTLNGDATFLEVVAPQRSTVHFTFFNTFTGSPEQQDWALFWSSERVVDQVAQGFVGSSYNYSVNDFFGNTVASGNVVVDDYPHDFVDISIARTNFDVQFSDGRSHHMRFEDAASGVSFHTNITPISLFADRSYNLEVLEDATAFPVAEFALLDIDGFQQTYYLPLAPKDLDELYWNQTRDMFVATFDGDGLTEEIRVGGNSDFQFITQTITIAAWIRLISSGAQDIVDKHQSGDNTGFLLRVASGGGINPSLGDGTTSNRGTTTGPITWGVWTLIGFTWDDVSQDVRAFINTTAETVDASFAGPISPNLAREFRVSSGWFGLVVEGEVANVQLYNSSFSDAEWSELWSRGLQGKPLDGKNLELHLPLADLWSGVAHDYSGNNLHGTPGGDVTFLEVDAPRRSTVHFTFFDAALGEPHDLQDWVLFWGSERVANRVSTGFVGTTSNYTVKSGFGSDLATGTATVDDYPTAFVDIVLTSYGFTVFNQRESCTLTQLTLDATGTGRTRFINQWQEFTWWVPGGGFTLNVTFYSDALCSTIDSYVEATFSISAANNFILTSVNTLARTIAAIDEADAKIEIMWDDLNSTWAAVNATHESLLLSWDTLNTTESNVRFVWNVGNNTWSSVNASTGQILGVYDVANNTWILLNQLDVPAGIAIIYDSYYIPPTNEMDLLSKDLAPGQTIDPFRTVIYTILNTSEGTGRLLLYRPYRVGWDVDDITLMRDDLHLVVVSGSLTRLWLNDTQDTDATGDDTIVLNITYTGYFDLTQFGDGLNLSLETEGTASVNATRVSQVRFVSTFLWSMDTTTREWTMTTNLANTLGIRWTRVNVFLAFPQELDPDPSTVVVRDVTASVNLEKGIHYDLTDGGVYLALTSLTSGGSKTWRITFFERVEGTSILEPRCSFGRVQTQRRGLVDMQRVEVACVNENPFDYRGRIVLVFDPSREVRHDSIIVEDLNGNILSNTAYWNDRDTLILTGVGVDSLETLQLVVWFRYTSDIVAITDILPWLPIIGLAFAAFTMIAYVAWRRQPRGSAGQERARVATIFLGIVGVISYVLWIYLLIAQGV